MAKSNLTIPKGWEKVSFGDVAKLRKGLTYKSSNYSDEYNGLVFLTLKSIMKGGGFNKKGIKYYLGNYDKSAVVQQGDLIIANTDITREAEVVGAPVFVPYLSEKPVIISMDLSAIDVDAEKIDKLFFYYLLRSNSARKFMRDQASGSTVLHLKTSNVPKFQFKLPIFPEQKKIADILSSVDEEIQKIDNTISETKKLKNGLMEDLFTKGVGHKKFKKTEYGYIPENWKVLELEKLCTKIGDGLHGTPRYLGGSEFYFINGNNISGRKITIYPGTKSISGEEYFLHKKDLTARSILLSINGTIGNIGFYNNEKVILGKSVAYINCDSSNNKEFIAYQLETRRITNYFSKSLTGTTINNLSLATIRQTPVFVPEIEEQLEIVKILSSIDLKLSLGEELKTRLTQLKKGLISDLLSGKVRTI
ncbi:MAG TPA: restriction endonuclease subunit S [Cytophagaceae bacterium]|jgi:type I restriction enzyme S subunit|nr:restriction endonuclease subunit S [Cytophagaceae bacterium]